MNTRIGRLDAESEGRANLTSRAGRKRLLPRRAPYWVVIGRGVALGWRRIKPGRAGTWVARCLGDDGRYAERALGEADDLVAADGHAVLSYTEAVQAAQARKLGRERDLSDTNKGGSDDTPAWAEALEHRLIAEIGKHVAVEIGKLRTVMERRFDGVRDDITVAMGATDHADRRTEQARADMAELRVVQAAFWQRLRTIERRLGKREGEG